MSPTQAMERSYAALKQLLREGAFPPGHRLEANRLAEQMGVSMTPVRDALNRLVGEQLVEASTGEPFAQLAGEGRAVEHQPAFVDDDQRRCTVEMRLDPVEQVGEHGGCRGASDQPFGLECLDPGLAEVLGLGVEQLAVRPADAIGTERLLERLRLEQHGEPGKGTFGDRRGGERAQSCPEMLLGLGIDCDSFGREDRSEPFGRPAALGEVVDPGERLEPQPRPYAGMGGEGVADER